jgi:glucosamine--fructose-6-phosphate aminotransferase (isomerizing)
MCGIFGYVGKKTDTPNMILEGLKLLEYRGYDSWGVAVKSDKKIVIDKHTGMIGNASVNLPQSTIGIGHTRWATHGGVTVENAHPHMDCKEQIAVLHNGIVENFAQIKEELLKKNHTFSSQTDTEVIVHLIEENMKKDGFATSVREAFNRLQGMNAIVVLNAAAKQIVAAKTGSPLIVGQNKDGFYLASDASGIIKHTNKLLFLKDKEMVILGDDLQLLQLPNGEQIQPNFEYVDWKTEDVTKGSYEHFMLKEIYEQPTVIRNIALRYSDDINSLAAIIDKAKGTFFIGSGTAFHACLVGSYLFSKIVKKHVNTAAASEFNYLEDFFD